MDEILYQRKFVNSVIKRALNKDEELSQDIIPIGNLAKDRVIEIYANDYKYRLLDTMKSNFESVWMVLGDEEFEKLSLEYIKNHPSLFFDLNNYGDKFPDFLLGIANENPVLLSELAKFEISFWQIFHSRNPNKVSVEEFTQQKLMNSVLSLEESVLFLSFDNNVFALFGFKDKTFEDFCANYTLEDIANNSFYIIYKKHFRVYCKDLTRGQFEFFKFIEGGDKTLEEALESITLPVEEIQQAFAIIGENLLSYLKEKT